MASLRIRQVGVAAVSFRDIAAELQISAPAIHHYFPAKDDLVAEVTARYRSEFASMVAAIGGVTSQERLLAFGALFDDATSGRLVCLCGAVASEWSAVGPGAQSEVAAFFADQRAWVIAELLDGAARGDLRADLDAEASAQLVVAALEGATLLSRATGRSQEASSVMRQVIALLE